MLELAALDLDVARDAVLELELELVCCDAGSPVVE
jgi:hypothetical protein